MAASLSQTKPYAASCAIQQLLAFPKSLAALKSPVQWNASCWVTNRRLSEFELHHISQYISQNRGFQQRTQHVEWCHFLSDIDSEVSLLIIFPNLKTSFRHEEVMEKWTDEVVLPSFQKHAINVGTLSQNFRIVRMTCEAEREETLNTNAPDTPLKETLSKREGITTEDLEKVWRDIVECAESNAFWGFKELFLVATCHRDGAIERRLSVEESWREVCSIWDAKLNMDYIPFDSLKAFAAVTVSPEMPVDLMAQKEDYAFVQMEHIRSSTILGENRKRGSDAQEDFSKRSKRDSQFRPWPMGRSHTTPAVVKAYSEGYASANQLNEDTDSRDEGSQNLLSYDSDMEL